MSMLAEPRRKQKIINLRAKNNAWSNDSTKFGQRMLEKMGWSSGKGLGAKENGIVEHVVARYKNDEKGLGFEDKNDQWTKHEDDFNSLLANLSNDGSVPETLHSGISLEKKSKKSKARIHYHKFTRGKDLSRYSEKDLANIFGKKSFKEVKEVEESIKDVKTTEQVFTEKGNMDDYFKDKLATFKSKLKLLSSNKIKEDDGGEYGFQGFCNSTEAVSECVKTGFDQPLRFSSLQKEAKQNIQLTSYPDVETTNIKKKKKSKKKNEIVNEVKNDLEEKYIQDRIQESNKDIEIGAVSLKRKKNKKSKEEQLQIGDEIIIKKKKNKSKINVENTLKHVSTGKTVPKNKKIIID